MKDDVFYTVGRFPKCLTCTGRQSGVIFARASCAPAKPARAGVFRDMTLACLRKKALTPKQKSRTARQQKRPVLFIAGEDDVIIYAEASARRLEKLLPDVQTHLLKNCGHAVMQAASLIIPFLDKKVITV